MEKRGILTSENMQTIIVVGFILAMLALILSMFNAYKMTGAAHVATDWLEHYSVTSADMQAEVQALRSRVSSLEKELTETRKIMVHPMVTSPVPVPSDSP